MMAWKVEDFLEIYCEAPISERLYYQLTVHYIPTLVNCIDWYYPIKIVGELEHSQLESAECFGTGISGEFDCELQKLLRKLSENICKESGIEFVDIKSNICTELYTMVHEMTVTSMFLHCRSYLVYIIFCHHILIKALHL